MKGWRDPVGPEPAQTYWIRRGVVGALIIALIVMVMWLATRTGGDGGTATSGPASSGTPASIHSAEPSPELSAEASPSASAAPSATASPTASPGPEASPTPTEAPTPVACQPKQLTLRIAGPDAVTGPDPVAFNVTVSTSQAACVLDLASAQAELVITSGSDRIWASSSCPAWQLAGTFEMKQGAEVSYEVGWPVGRANGCELSGTTLGAGTYVATASIGTASARHVMTLRP